MKASDDHLYVGMPSQEVENACIRFIHGLFHFGKGPLMMLIKHSRAKFNLDATEIEFADDTFSWPQDGKSFTGLVALHPYYFSRCNL
jgi:hypothetical protein